jgi:phage terminase large subunit-like protein
MKLHPFQVKMLSDYFAGVVETLILISKKNGKTTLMAALALYHLVVTKDAECVIAAASRDQAAIVLRQARGFITRSEPLQRLMKMQKREINSLVDEGRIRVLASDEDTADGVIPTLAIVDELHRHKTSALYGVFRDGLGPRQGQMITISTAGDDLESPLGQMRAAATTLPGLERDGAYRHVIGNDFALHEWALDESDDRRDMKVVKLANPAPWQTEADLRRRFKSPSMKPWQWARFACGIWMFGELGAFSAEEWRACEDLLAQIPESATEVFIGVDLGFRWDTTAIVPIWRDADGKFVIGSVSIIVPPRDGSATDARVIFDACEALTLEFKNPTFVIDPEADGEQLAQRLDRELECEVVEHSQKPTAMALAAQRLSEAIASQKLRHPGNSELTTHVLAAAPKPVGEGWRLVKPKRSNAVIDGAIALAMALSVGMADPEPDWEPMAASV